MCISYVPAVISTPVTVITLSYVNSVVVMLHVVPGSNANIRPKESQVQKLSYNLSYFEIEVHLCVSSLRSILCPQGVFRLQGVPTSPLLYL